MSASLVLAAEGLCPPGPPAPGWVRISEARIVEVGAGAAPPGAVDLGDAVLAPAFVDLQVNGVGPDDFASADPGGWRQGRQTLGRHGVGSFLATFVSAPADAYDEPLRRLAAARDEAVDGAATLLGAHLEGPFLGGAPGAHSPALLRPADRGWLAGRLEQPPGVVRMVTLAPEADPGLGVTRWLAGAGVLVAVGHTTASEADVRAAADAGARVVTHLFNGMPPLHHRAPGVVGAGLDDPRLTPTVIADLEHVHATPLRIVFAAKGEVAVVSDAVAAGPGRGAARRADGTLVGATTLLDGAVANLVAVGVPMARAVASVTVCPARLLGHEDRGILVAGARADLVALDPATGALRAVWLAGAAVA